MLIPLMLRAWRETGDERYAGAALVFEDLFMSQVERTPHGYFWAWGHSPTTQVGGATSGELLLRRLNTHLEEVSEIYDRVIHAQQPIYYTPAPSAPAPEPGGPPP